MEHIVTFLMLVSLMSSVALTTVTFMLRQQFRQKASTWFGIASLGLGCFVLEILMYRYGSSLESGQIIEFSKFWALAGSLLLATALPRLTRLMTGLQNRALWRIAEFVILAATFLAGVVFLFGLGGSFVVSILQILVFGTTVASVLFIALVRPKPSGKTGRQFLVRIMVWSAFSLPLIILDAVGGILPAALNDLPMSLFLPGLCLASVTEVRKLFGKPAYLSAGLPSSFFLKQFEISNREAEVLTLVIEGENNIGIGQRLFISGKTVENHLTSIFRKTNVKNRIQLFRLINSSSEL